MDEAISPRLPDEGKRRELVSYIIKRLKAELPNGLESVSADSLHKLSVKIGKEYAYAHADGFGGGMVPKPTAWTPELEKLFREAILNGVGKDDLDRGKKICDCVVTKIKKIYPDSVMLPFPHEVILKVASECKTEILGNGKN